MSAARTTRDASMADSFEAKMFPFRDRNSTMPRRLRCQLLQSEPTGSGRKSHSLRYQYSFMGAKVRVCPAWKI